MGCRKKDWLFSVADVCNILSDSQAKDKNAYWRKLKQCLKNEGSEVVSNCHELKLVAEDWKKYKTDVMYTKDILRIVQSIPSPKAESFKMWLAQGRSERLVYDNARHFNAGARYIGFKDIKQYLWEEFNEYYRNR